MILLLQPLQAKTYMMNQIIIIAAATVLVSICARGDTYDIMPKQLFKNVNNDTEISFQSKRDWKPLKQGLLNSRQDVHHYNFDTVTEDCPTWMYKSNSSSKCICGVDNDHTVKCNQESNKVYILDSYRMTFDEKYKEILLGTSLYGMYSPNDNYENYHIVPMNVSELNEAMCGHFNRKGRLCSECKEGYSPLVYSYNAQCKLCSDTQSRHNILKFIGVAFIPLTLFYFIVVLFKFNANSPELHGFLNFAHFCSSSYLLRTVSMITNTNNTSIGIKVFGTIYGIWNLDFFRTLYPDICLKVTTLQAFALDYLIAFYPLLLILITLAAFKLHSRDYRIVNLIWYPFNKCLLTIKKDRSKKSSMIDVFATFLLLSYGRIMSVSYNLIIFTTVVNVRGEVVGRYLYYDPSYEFLGKEHLPYGILALLISTCFNILPLLLLLFYPMNWFQKCLNRLRLSHVALHTFVDSFAGCYKDGTEPGTRDCRYFAALYLLIRILLYTTIEATLTALFYGLAGIITTGFLILYVLFQPYKSKYTVYNKISITMIAVVIITLFGIINISTAYDKMYDAKIFSLSFIIMLVCLPQLYIIVIAIRWTGVCKHMKCRWLISQMIKSNKTEEESLLISPSRERNGRNLYDAA